MANLSGKTALITGASRGIGAAIAQKLCRLDAHIVAVGRTVGGLEELDDVIRAAGSTARLVPLDLKDVEGIARLAAALDQRHGRVDILVGNAAIYGPPTPLGHVPPNEWEEVIAVNITANWHLIRCMEPLLKRSDAGRAVFVTSGAASSAQPYRGAYSVSKAALDVLARTWAAETASTAIRVNLFNPGPTRTRMRAQAMPGEDPTTLPTPADVADKLVGLCLPSFTATGKLYDFKKRALLEFQPPAPPR